MPMRVWNKSNNASTFFGPHTANTSQFAPPTAGAAGVWLPVDLDILNCTQAVESALGPGNSRVVTFRNNITQTGSSMTLADPDLNDEGDINGTLVAAVSTAQSSSNLGRQLDGGSPPFEPSRISFYYLDTEDDERSWHGVGNPTGNNSINATPEYMGVGQASTTTTEAVTRVIACAPFTLETVFVRFSNNDTATYQLAIMINGVATVIGTLDADTTALYTFNPDIHLDALDEFSFRIVRTAGAGTNCVTLIELGIIPDAP